MLFSDRLGFHRKTAACLKTPISPSLSKPNGTGYRSCGRTNADRPKQAGQACSQACSVARTAGQSSTTAPPTALRNGRIILSAPTIKVTREPAPFTFVHFIREIVLYALLLEHVRGVIRYVRQFEKVFVRQVSRKSAEEQKAALAGKRKALQKAQERTEEIDRLFKRIYEDSATGRLSEERYESCRRTTKPNKKIYKARFQIYKRN